MARQAGVQLLAVPFRDAGALFAAVAAGEVDFTAISMNTVAGLVAAGRLRPLAVGSLARLAAHPQIPTLAEAGGPAVEMRPWAAWVTVAGTPAPILERLQRDLLAAIDTAEVRRMADNAGFELTPSTPQALRERVATDLALYTPLVRAGRVTPL
jgi:tripartite-type tricarboxylate transporter receptor subunit TctC